MEELVEEWADAFLTSFSLSLSAAAEQQEQRRELQQAKQRPLHDSGGQLEDEAEGCHEDL